MKSILLIVGAGLLPLLGVSQATPYARTASEQVPREQLRSVPLLGANQLILVTPDSLPEAMHKMRQLVEGKGYQMAECTSTILTTTSKHVQDGVQNYITSRKWFFFRKRTETAPDPPVSFRLRVRAFRLPTGTQLQVVGVYIQEGCADCANWESAQGIGRPMKSHERDVEERLYSHPSWKIEPPTPFRVVWEENCFWEVREIARQYIPASMYFGYVRWDATTGARAW